MTNDNRGRPPRTINSTNHHQELERLLVEGELVEGDDGKPTRVYPQSNEIARRLQISTSWVSKFARSNRCFERRADLRAQIATKAQAELVRHEAKRVAFDTERMLQLCDKVLGGYETFLTENAVANMTVADLNTTIRLRRYLMGDADSRHEVTHGVTLEMMQTAHRDVLRNMRQATSAECGMDGENVVTAQKPLASSFDDGVSGSEVDQKIHLEGQDMNVP